MRKLLPFGLITLFLFSCKKETEYLVIPEKRFTELKEVNKEVITSLSEIVKVSPEFKSLVETECLKQEHGDYEVRMEKLLEIDNVKQVIPSNFRNHFRFLVSELKRLKPDGIPVIFVPVMEKRDPSSSRDSISFPNDKNGLVKVNAVKANSSTPDVNKVIFVPREDFSDNSNIVKSTDERGDCQPPYYYPGYVTDNEGYLEYIDCINEAYAFNYDVWIIGFEENIEGDNNYANIEGYSTVNSYQENLFRSNTFSRNGSPEYGALFQVPDLPQLESWIWGKVELKYTVHDANGNLI
ncbi:MAG: hypothetical protein K2X37_03110 [Chitinophagaceae bacterium]|nr:hypothetical protein [Chitinophagaceae bacterium]